MTPLEKIKAWLAEGREIEKNASRGPWIVDQPFGTKMRSVNSQIEMDDGTKLPTMDWIIGHMQVSNSPNYREDALLIADARTRIVKQAAIIELLLQAFYACPNNILHGPSAYQLALFVDEEIERAAELIGEAK